MFYRALETGALNHQFYKFQGFYFFEVADAMQLFHWQAFNATKKD